MIGGSPSINSNLENYHPDFGYVDIHTLTPFYVVGENDWPTSGSMEFIGAQGSRGGNTRAKLTATLNGFIVSVDEDGDGLYEVDMEIASWMEI